MQHRVGGEIDRKIAAVDAVEHLREAGRPEPFADHEAVLLEHRQLVGIQLEREGALLRGRGLVELLVELGRGRIEIELREVLALASVALGEPCGRERADVGQLLLERSRVAEHVVGGRRDGRLGGNGSQQPAGGGCGAASQDGPSVHDACPSMDWRMRADPWTIQDANRCAKRIQGGNRKKRGRSDRMPLPPPHGSSRR